MSQVAVAPKMINLQSSDSEFFTVSREVIRFSKTINDLLQNLGLDDEDDDSEALAQKVAQPIPVEQVNGAILRKVLDWCERHQADADTDDTKGLEKFDADFLKVDQGTLFELILAANYLDIKGLLEGACKAVANSLKGKSVEELRSTLGIENDFTPEEEEQLRKENAWCED